MRIVIKREEWYLMILLHGCKIRINLELIDTVVDPNSGHFCCVSVCKHVQPINVTLHQHGGVQFHCCRGDGSYFSILLFVCVFYLYWGDINQSHWDYSVPTDRNQHMLLGLRSAGSECKCNEMSSEVIETHLCVRAQTHDSCYFCTVWLFKSTTNTSLFIVMRMLSDITCSLPDEQKYT